MAQQVSAKSDSIAYRFQSIIGGSVGNLVEWYDWYVYSAFSLYFAATFFPESDETAQLLNTAGIFAIGFLMRPIGGWIMGKYADKKGRKAALNLIRIVNERWLVNDNLRTRLSPNWYCGTFVVGFSPNDSGFKYRWRIWNCCNLSERNGYREKSRLLLQLSIHHINHGSIDSVNSFAAVATHIFNTRAITCLGLAHPVRYWRITSHIGSLHAP